ncbi:hypothetical protein HMPREF2821_08340 [Staphylococcus sp. HMSC065C10]|uniref:hypothetical protein n=1 Tax=Staphylococcus sp. HMSC065C10 TaxID=1739325 RepID=UPI0008A2721D|nr:hypothetical protein [Staphylococcus sp. HMSC065C10]OFK31642.1 hypothetical protein HMPREF2821_08340 [Staphylococcus sp. HMSC065C10]
MKDQKYYALLGKINELEQRVSQLEDDIFKSNEKEEANMPKLNKNQLVQQVKNVIESKLLDDTYEVKKAIPKNGEGSGLFLNNKNNPDNSKKVMLKQSKDYSKQYNFIDEYKYSGWFVVSNDEINMYDAFIFVVFDTHNNSHYFIFDHEEMLDVLKSKNLDNNGRYHFYLAEDHNSQYFDHREGGLLLPHHVNQWSYILNLMS